MAGERYLAFRPVREGRVHRSLHPVHLTFRPSFKLQLNWVKHSHIPVGAGVEVFPYAPFHQRKVYYVVTLCNSYFLSEHLDALRSIAPSPYTADGRHTRVVPASYIVVLDKFQELAFAHYGICEVEPCKLVLVAREDTQLLNEPVVQRTVHIKLQSTDTVGDALYGIALAVGVVVHRVDAPLGAGAVVRSVVDAVHYRIAEEHVRMSHVYLGSQNLLTFLELAVSHIAEELQVLLHAAVSPRRRCPGLLDCSPVEADLLQRLVVHIGQAFLYQFLSPVVQLLEIVGGISFLSPFKTQPADVVLY